MIKLILVSKEEWQIPTLSLKMFLYKKKKVIYLYGLSFSMWDLVP